MIWSFNWAIKDVIRTMNYSVKDVLIYIFKYNFNINSNEDSLKFVYKYKNNILDVLNELAPHDIYKHRYKITDKFAKKYNITDYDNESLSFKTYHDKGLKDLARCYISQQISTYIQNKKKHMGSDAGCSGSGFDELSVEKRNVLRSMFIQYLSDNEFLNNSINIEDVVLPKKRKKYNTTKNNEPDTNTSISPKKTKGRKKKKKKISSSDTNIIDHSNISDQPFVENTIDQSNIWDQPLDNVLKDDKYFCYKNNDIITIDGSHKFCSNCGLHVINGFCESLEKYQQSIHSDDVMNYEQKEQEKADELYNRILKDTNIIVNNDEEECDEEECDEEECDEEECDDEDVKNLYENSKPIIDKIFEKDDEDKLKYCDAYKCGSVIDTSLLECKTCMVCLRSFCPLDSTYCFSTDKGVICVFCVPVIPMGGLYNDPSFNIDFIFHGKFPFKGLKIKSLINYTNTTVPYIIYDNKYILPIGYNVEIDLQEFGIYELQIKLIQNSRPPPYILIKHNNKRLVNSSSLQNTEETLKNVALKAHNTDILEFLGMYGLTHPIIQRWIYNIMVYVYSNFNLSREINFEYLSHIHKYSICDENLNNLSPSKTIENKILLPKQPKYYCRWCAKSKNIHFNSKKLYLQHIENNHPFYIYDNELVCDQLKTLKKQNTISKKIKII